MAAAAAAAFGQQIQREFTPVVMVLSSSKAEELCQKNGLSFVDLIRPHSVTSNINVPVRTASEQPYRLQDFRLRIFRAENVAPSPVEAAEEYLTRVVSHSCNAAHAELKGDPRDVNAVMDMVVNMGSPINTWYYNYCREFFRTLCFSDHEAFDHPVTCLLVVASAEANPIKACNDLWNPDRLPALFNDGTMDPKVLKHYVLLHDVHDTPLERAEALLQDMRAMFGSADCSLLKLNSRTTALPREDIWSRWMVPFLVVQSRGEEEDTASAASRRASILTNGDAAANGVGQYGHHLSDEDIEGVEEFVADLAVKAVIPHMEQKIRMLNHQISATRKGLKNQLRNLWWRKGKDEFQESSSREVTPYTHNSMESQIRLLADLAFMLRDYDLALSNYRLLTGDYKTDKAWKHFAGTQELIGLCLFFLDQSRREMEQCLDTAYNHYQRTGFNSVRHATRAALWLAEIQKSKGLFREAAAVLMRASSTEESNLRAAIMLEQAGYCFLRTSPPMPRKYGFHMVLAGHQYSKSQQRNHSLRVYDMVLGVYEGKGWAHINDHINFALGRLYGFLERYGGAVEYFMRLLLCTHQTAELQRTFLREFLHWIKRASTLKSTQEEVDRFKSSLDLPVVNQERVYVLFEDQVTYGSPEAAEVGDEIWAGLEDGLIPRTSTTMGVPTWMEAARRRTSGLSSVAAMNTCVAGEEVVVVVEFSNPLQVTIDVSSVRVVCEFSPVDENTEMAALSSPSTPPKRGILRSSSVSSIERDEKDGSFSGLYHSFHEGVGRVASFSGLGHEDRKCSQSDEIDAAEEKVEGMQGQLLSSSSSQGESESEAALDRSVLLLSSSSDSGQKTEVDDEMRRPLEQLDPLFVQYRTMDAQALAMECSRLGKLSEDGDKSVNLYLVYIACERLLRVPSAKDYVRKLVDGLPESIRTSQAFRLLEQRHGSEWRQDLGNASARGNADDDQRSVSGMGSEEESPSPSSCADSGRPPPIVMQTVGAEQAQAEQSKQADDAAEPALFLPEESFSLKPGETAKVRLRVQTLKEGILKVTGVEWVLCGIAHGRRMFVPGPKRKRPSKGNSRRSRDRRTVPPSRRLCFRVARRMPRLEAALHEFPESVHEGELRRMVLELTNTGLVPLKRMRIKFSHPGFLCMGQQSDLDPEFPLCLDAGATRRALSARLERTGSAATDPLAFPLPDVGSGQKGHIFSFSPSTRLDGGSTLLWPLWLHARQSGIQTFHMLVYYEPAGVDASGTNPGMKYRTLRMMRDIQVVPSLRVSVKTTPSPQNVEQYVARVDIENQSQQDAFMLRQLSCWSPSWRLIKMSARTSSVDDNTVGKSGPSAAFGIASSGCAYNRSTESCAYPVHLLSPAVLTSLYFHLQPKVPTPVEHRRRSTVAAGVSVKVSSSGDALEPSHTSSIADEFEEKSRSLSTNLCLGTGHTALPLIDVAAGPVHRFHLHERALQSAASAAKGGDSSPKVGCDIFQGKRSVRRHDDDSTKDDDFSQQPGPQSVDFVLLWEHRRTRESWMPSRTEQLSTFGSQHVCHCSVTGPTPVRWVLEAPPSVSHNFSSSASLEVPLSLVILNCSGKVASVHIETLDPVVASSSLTLSGSEGGDGKSTPRGGGGSHATALLSSKGGWYKPVATERLPSASSSGSVAAKRGLPGGPVSVDSASTVGNQTADLLEEHLCSVPQSGPYLWLGSTCRVLKGLDPGKKVSVPLRISVFAPGVYDLCYYRVSWKLAMEQASACGSPETDAAKAGRGAAQPGRSPTRIPPRHSVSRGPYLHPSDSMSRSFSSYQSLPNSPLSQAGDAPQRHPSSSTASRPASAATAGLATAGGDSSHSAAGDAVLSGGSGRPLAETEVLSTTSGTVVDPANDGWNSGSMIGNSVLLTVLDSGI